VHARVVQDLHTELLAGGLALDEERVGTGHTTLWPPQVDEWKIWTHPTSSEGDSDDVLETCYVSYRPSLRLAHLASTCCHDCRELLGPFVAYDGS
jgi:hypothetical protein